MPRRLRAKRGSRQEYLTRILQLRVDLAVMEASLGYKVAQAMRGTYS